MVQFSSHPWRPSALGPFHPRRHSNLAGHDMKGLAAVEWRIVTADDGLKALDYAPAVPYLNHSAVSKGFVAVLRRESVRDDPTAIDADIRRVAASPRPAADPIAGSRPEPARRHLVP